jgi:hypothetical protein
MSVSKWRYTENCDGAPCPGDCDECGNEEVKTMDCFVCGGKDTVEYITSNYNGHKRGHCTKCGMQFIE